MVCRTVFDRWLCLLAGCCCCFFVLLAALVVLPVCEAGSFEGRMCATRARA